MRIEARIIDDGRGPYRWRAVVRTNSGLALGTIYNRVGDDLTPEETARAREWLGESWEIREVPA